MKGPHVPVFGTDPFPIISTIFVHFQPFVCKGKGRSWGQKEASAGDPVAGPETAGIWDLGFGFEGGLSPWPAPPHGDEGFYITSADETRGKHPSDSHQ